MPLIREKTRNRECGNYGEAAPVLLRTKAFSRSLAGDEKSDSKVKPVRWEASASFRDSSSR